MKTETVESLNLSSGDHVIDCTAGGGGHTALLLKKVFPDGHVSAFDRDHTAISSLEKKFQTDISENKLKLYHTNFSEIGHVFSHLETKIKGIIADLGVSSPQIDNSERGFSFMKDGPLDMRMSPESGGPTAADILATADQYLLEKIFRDYGEEPKSKFVAKAIIEYRKVQPIVSTLQFAKIVSDSIHYKKKSKKHPATKVFQALRIYVNNELDEINRFLSSAFDILAPGGRMSIITFHSLEDRIVKLFFKEKAGKVNKDPILNSLPLTHSELSKYIKVEAKIIKPFPATPSTSELATNPRSRSAKLRTLEKL